MNVNVRSTDLDSCALVLAGVKPQLTDQEKAEYETLKTIKYISELKKYANKKYAMNSRQMLRILGALHKEIDAIFAVSFLNDISISGDEK